MTRGRHRQFLVEIDPRARSGKKCQKSQNSLSLTMGAGAHKGPGHQCFAMNDVIDASQITL